MYTIDMLMEILKYAKDLNATNVHMASGTIPKVRVDGQLKEMSYERILPKDTEHLINRLLNEEQKNMLNSRRYISLPIAFKNIGRIRMNIFMQRGSFSINFKLLDRMMKTDAELGIPAVVTDLGKLKSGLVLICGGRNSGKSTTMAVIIRKISESRECHIITIEDPIEYLYKHDRAIVNQKEIGLDVNSYNEGVYSAITQDPDVIMVSFSGDPDTFSAVLTAAENGHLVFTTLQTIGTVKTIEYILGMYPADRRNHIKLQLSNVLQAIISQVLIPNISDSGYELAVELMFATNTMKNLILENKTHQIPAAIKASRTLEMITMEDSVNELYMKGLISKENALNLRDIY